jgi:hypothetical protein
MRPAHSTPQNIRSLEALHRQLAVSRKASARAEIIVVVLCQGE